MTVGQGEHWAVLGGGMLGQALALRLRAEDGRLLSAREFLPAIERTGKILRLDLTAQRAIEIDTADYRSWGGGHGLGSALFWDFCKDKTITDGRHPANVCCVMTSPL